MKNFLLFFALLLSAGLAATVDPDFGKVQLSGAGTDGLIVKMDAPLAAETEVLIQDSRGTVLHRDVVSAGNVLAKQYDLNQLPTGAYEFVLINYLFEDRYSFSIDNYGIRVSPTGRERQHKPMFRTRHGITNLTYLNAERKKVSVTLNDELGREVYTEILDADAVVTRRYNFRQLPRGTYTLVVKTGRDRVTHELAL